MDNYYSHTFYGSWGNINVYWSGSKRYTIFGLNSTSIKLNLLI